MQQATKHDRILSKLLRYVREGRPTQIPEKLKAYRNHQNEITIEHECLLWGIRVIDHPYKSATEIAGSSSRGSR